MRLVTAAEMRALEAAADAAGHAYAHMMDLAGAAVAEAAWPWLAGGAAVVLCGPGNNGGDGLVAAARLAKRGADVRAILWRREGDECAVEAAAAGVRLLEAERMTRGAAAVGTAAPRDDDGGGMVGPSASDGARWAGPAAPALEAEILASLQEADVFVDALLGTGARLPLPDDLAQLLRHVAAARHRSARRPRIVAVDLPTGVDADTGRADAAALPADVTVTFGFAKPGHVLLPGAALTGRLVVDAIGLADDGAPIGRLVVDPIGLAGDGALTGRLVIDPIGLAGDGALTGRLVIDPIGLARGAETLEPPLAVATSAEVASMLPARAAGGHKGTFGTVLVVAGSLTYSGAAALAAAAAVRSGAGLVTVAGPRVIHAALAAHAPEATFLPLGDGDTVTAAGAAAVLQAATTIDALLVGPGLTAGPEPAAFLAALLDQPPACPWVLDADALNLLAAHPELLERLPPQSILTPHPGEMARLAAAYGLVAADGTALDAAAVGADRLGIARAVAARSGAVVVLKGAGTVVASPDGAARIVAVATPALATAGTGDVLAGMTAALLAGGAGAWEAAVAAAWAHGAAGQRVALQVGERGARARDVIEALPAVWSALTGA